MPANCLCGGKWRYFTDGLLSVSFYTERSMFKRADFQYQMMLLHGWCEDCETINVRPEAEYLIMNSS